jgi:ATP-binding cassette subfamily B protein
VLLTTNNVQGWQAQIAHVPQSIYLADTTIKENIAFGVSADDIDLTRLKNAATRADMGKFVSSLPDGYDTVVGEGGVRLSGGQRQRIGIARALYRQADVLVFDEATSALDGATEADVMAAIRSLDSELTILIIAHRLSTVEHCDKIVRIDGGHIVAQGSYEAVVEGAGAKTFS